MFKKKYRDLKPMGYQDCKKYCINNECTKTKNKTKNLCIKSCENRCS